MPLPFQGSPLLQDTACACNERVCCRVVLVKGRTTALHGKTPAAMTTMIVLLLFTFLCLLLSGVRAWDNVTMPGRNDVVFEGRNRAYGAFALRREYERRFLFAFAGALALLGSAVLVPTAWVRLFGHVSAVVERSRGEIVVDIVVPPLELPKPAPVKAAASTPPTPAPIPQPSPAAFPVVVDSLPVDPGPGPEPRPDPGPSAPGPPGGTVDPGGEPGASLGSDLGTSSNPVSAAEVDSLPEFIGGHGAMVRWVQDHIRFPEEEAAARKEFVQFVVDTDGRVMQVKAKGRAGKAHAAAAEHVVAGMPPWKPAVRKGRRVACVLVLPIEFRTQ
jgi:protein TonB